MTDSGIDDIYRLVEAALKSGQKSIPIHIFPFRLTAENLAAHKESAWAAFWNNLAEGDRLFLKSGERASSPLNRRSMKLTKPAPPAILHPMSIRQLTLGEFKSQCEAQIEQVRRGGLVIQ